MTIRTFTNNFTSSLASKIAVICLAVLLLGVAAPPASARDSAKLNNRAYIDAIDRTEAMVYNEQIHELARRHGLDVVNVAWEDTGRYDNSSVGPNISDVTIQVQRPIEGTDQHSLALMPVIRYPNFTDRTADIGIDELHLPVGNESGGELSRVSLQEYLANIDEYLSDRGGANGPRLNLLAERDSHVLVSAQAAFLPVPENGIATFNPVIFNYQSSAGNPAVLTIIATTEGTSATIIDNQRDGFASGGSWGQRLFHNIDGERASLTGERTSDVIARLDDELNGDAESEFADRPGQPPRQQARVDDESNVVIIIQIPLKHESFLDYDFSYAEEAEADCFECALAPSSDVENAVIGHGDIEGPFTELDGLEIERDPDFPVRVTVQFYKATATGQVTADDMASIAADIEKIYEHGDLVGSLVTEGLTGRPTEYSGNHVQPDGWWAGFFGHRYHG